MIENELYSFFSIGFLSFFTALISAATGMGGGVIFLIGLNQFFPLSSTIPIHGVAQLKNNVMRVFLLRNHLKAKICINFFIGCFIGVLIILNWIKDEFNPLFPYMIILSLVIYSLLKPNKMPSLKIPEFGFFFLGLFTGLLGIIIGAVDPLLSPFFIRDDFNRQEIVANKSFFQALIHLAKIPVFLYLGFNYLAYWDLLIFLILTGIFGTFVGTKLLNYISQLVFMKIYKTILMIVALKLGYNIYLLL